MRATLLCSPDDAEIEHIGEGLIARTLPRPEWTHEAHLATTTYLLTRRPDIDVDKQLPGFIRAYNESVGGVNSDSEGYHETITQCFIRAVRLFWKAIPTIVVGKRSSAQAKMIGITPA